tara:strand:+ start:48 stop:512 length:465 start_codon:yes stop_codon:yes gene_type:complete
MVRKCKTKRKCKKGGTKSEERRRDTISKAIEGKKYKYRSSVNDIIGKLEKTVGNEYVGPPDFKGTHTWTSKYEELKNIMPVLGKRDNDSTLIENGSTYYKLKGLKKTHDIKVVENESHHREITEMLSQLPPIPSTSPTKVRKLTVKKSRTRSSK